MSENTVFISPHQRFVYDNGNVRIEQEQSEDVGTVWKCVAELNHSEIAQLLSGLNGDNGLPKELKTLKADSRGRINLGPEYSNEDVTVAVVDSSEPR